MAPPNWCAPWRLFPKLELLPAAMSSPPAVAAAIMEELVIVAEVNSIARLGRPGLILKDYFSYQPLKESFLESIHSYLTLRFKFWCSCHCGIQEWTLGCELHHNIPCGIIFMMHFVLSSLYFQPKETRDGVEWFVSFRPSTFQQSTRHLIHCDVTTQTFLSPFGRFHSNTFCNCGVAYSVRQKKPIFTSANRVIHANFTHANSAPRQPWNIHAGARRYQSR